MTMSDNNSGWTSCMAWQHTGAYSAGTIEMMNSNLAVVAYLKNEDKPFFFDGHELPNKFWRSLVFVHKDLLLVGKNYPYQSKKMEEIILDKIQELLYNNLKWKYQYKKQQYYDLIKYSKSNSYIKNYLGRGFDKHKIYVYMNYAMYNDFIEDTDTSYLCCRNYVKNALYLNLCGKLTCICCGKEIYNESDDDFYEDDISTSRKYCDDCEENYKCKCCGTLSKSLSDKLYTVLDYFHYTRERKICKDCLKNEYFYDSNRDIFIRKFDLDFESIKHYNQKPVYIVDDISQLDSISDKIKENVAQYGFRVNQNLLFDIGVDYEMCILLHKDKIDFDFIKEYNKRFHYYSKFYYVLREDANKLGIAKQLCMAPVTEEWFINYDNAKRAA